MFTDRDARFHEMLENFYKVRSIEWRDRQKQVVLDNKENKNSP